MRAALIGLALLLTPCPALASLLTVTWDGRLTNGVDTYDTLGLGTNLTGAPISIVMTVDTARPGAVVAIQPGLFSVVSGIGPVNGGDSSPVRSVIFTINNISRALDVNALSTFGKFLAPYTPSDELSAATEGSVAGQNDGHYVERSSSFLFNPAAANAFTTASFDENVSGTFSGVGSADYFGSNPDVLGAFSYSYFQPDPNTPVLERISGSLSTASYRLTISSDAIAPVPEPATWVMMAAGFLLAGLTLRRSRVAIFRAGAA